MEAGGLSALPLRHAAADATDSICSLAVVHSAEGLVVACGGADGQLLAYRCDPQCGGLARLPAAAPPSPAPVAAVALSPAGDRLAACWAWDGGAWLHPAGPPAAAGQAGYPQRAAVPGAADRVTCLAFRPDGRQLAVGFQSGAVSLVGGGGAGKVLATAADGADWVFALAFSPGGGRLASGGFDSKVRLYDCGEDRLTLRATLAAAADYVLALSFSSAVGNGTELLAAASMNGCVRLYRLGQQKPVVCGSIHASSAAVQSIAFHPSRPWLAAASKDRGLRLYDCAAAAQPALLRVVKDARGGLLAVRFSPDGRWLFTGSLDRTLRVYEVLIDGNVPSANVFRIESGGAVGPQSACRPAPASTRAILEGEPLVASAALVGRAGEDDDDDDDSASTLSASSPRPDLTATPPRRRDSPSPADVSDGAIMGEPLSPEPEADPSQLGDDSGLLDGDAPPLPAPPRPPATVVFPARTRSDSNDSSSTIVPAAGEDPAIVRPRSADSASSDGNVDTEETGPHAAVMKGPPTINSIPRIDVQPGSPAIRRPIGLPPADPPAAAAPPPAGDGGNPFRAAAEPLVGRGSVGAAAPQRRNAEDSDSVSASDSSDGSGDEAAPPRAAATAAPPWDAEHDDAGPRRASGSGPVAALTTASPFTPAETGASLLTSAATQSRSRSPMTLAWISRLQGRWDQGQILSHPKGVSRVRFSNDGDGLAVVGVWDPAVLIYDTPDTASPSYTLEHRLEDATDLVLSACFSEAGDRLATCSQDRAVRVYDMTALPPRLLFEVSKPGAHAAAIAFCNAEACTGVAERRRRRRRARKPAGTGADDSSSSSGDSVSDSDSESSSDAEAAPPEATATGHTLAVAFSDRTLAFYFHHGRRPEAEFVGSEDHHGHGGVTALSYSVGSAALAAGCRDGTVLLYACNRKQPAITDEQADQAEPIACVELNPRGDLLAVVVAQDQRVLLYGVEGGLMTPLYSLFDAMDSVLCVRFAPTDALFAAGAKDGRFRVYTLTPTSMHCLAVVPAADWVVDLDFQRGAKRLATGCSDGTVVVFNLAA